MRGSSCCPWAALAIASGLLSVLADVAPRAAAAEEPAAPPPPESCPWPPVPIVPPPVPVTPPPPAPCDGVLPINLPAALQLAHVRAADVAAAAERIRVA